MCSKRSLRLVDLFREWDANNDGRISRKEFREAVMQRLKLDLTAQEVDSIFSRCDPDGSGEVSFKELKVILAPSRRTLSANFGAQPSP